MSDLTDMHNERLVQVNAELRAEIERLRAENAQILGASDLLCEGKDAEIRALRAKCDELRAQIIEASRALAGEQEKMESSQAWNVLSGAR